MFEKIWSKLKKMELKAAGATVEGVLGLRYGLDIPRLQNRLRLGHRVNLDRGVSIIMSATPSNQNEKYLVQIGDKVYVNRYTILDATAKIEIGAHTMIGPHCYITDHDHDFKGASIDKPIGELPIEGSPVRIGDNVWIGSHVVILKGVTIGDNSIIGAGSVVTKSIPPNSVAVGNPCRVLKERG